MLFLALALLGLIGTEHRHNSFLNHTQQRLLADAVVDMRIPRKIDGIECVLYREIEDMSTIFSSQDQRDIFLLALARLLWYNLCTNQMWD